MSSTRDIFRPKNVLALVLIDLNAYNVRAEGEGEKRQEKLSGVSAVVACSMLKCLRQLMSR